MGNTCSHLKNNGFELAIMCFDDNPKSTGIVRTVKYIVCCEECRDRYKSFGTVLENNRDIQNWLNGKKHYPIIDNYLTNRS
jgi:hypothetical protein